MSTLLERAIAKLNAGRKIAPTLKHTIDSANAKSLLKALHKEGVALDAGTVQEIAIRNGWRISDAAELAEIASRIGAGQRVVIKYDKGWGQRTVSQLKADLSSASSGTTD